MDIGAISIRYAKALFAFAEDNKEEDQVYKEMYSYSSMYMKNPEMKDLFENPIISDQDKLKLLTIAAGVNLCATTTRFLKFVVDKHKEVFMIFIAVSYQNLYRKRKKIVLTEITTAHKLSQEEIDDIILPVKNKYENSTIQLEIKHDPSIIGGYILKAENRKLDASISGELTRIKKELMK